MDQTLSRFIAERCYARYDTTAGLHALHRTFLQSLPNDRERFLWPRWKFRTEIEREYLTGTDTHGVLQIAGIALTPATLRKWSRDDGGRLRLVAAA